MTLPSPQRTGGITMVSHPLRPAGFFRLPLCRVSGLTSNKRLLKQVLLSSYAREIFLFMDGNEVDSFTLVLKGKMKEYFCTDDGEECLRRLLTPGSFISLHLVFTGQMLHTYSCEAISAFSGITWKKSTFLNIIAEEPELARRVAEILAQCMESSCRHTCLCRKPLAIARVAGYLLSRSHQLIRNPLTNGRDNGLPQTNLRPMELSAREVCLARETFSRALSSLQDQGYIKVKKWFGRHTG